MILRLVIVLLVQLAHLVFPATQAAPDEITKRWRRTPGRTVSAAAAAAGLALSVTLDVNHLIVDVVAAAGGIAVRVLAAAAEEINAAVSGRLPESQRRRCGV